jgi:lysozyme family protein
MNLDLIIAELIEKEGGYVNHPSDRGGETNFGITVAVARQNGYQGAMKDLTKAQARDIYKSQYWHRPNFDLVNTVSPAVANEIFDAGVLSGTATASRWLQLALNRLNMREKLYPDLKEDGNIGQKTVGALSDYLRHRKSQGGEQVLVTALNCLQGHHFMVTAVERHQANEDFVFGWIKHRIKL